MSGRGVVRAELPKDATRDDGSGRAERRRPRGDQSSRRVRATASFGADRGDAAGREPAASPRERPRDGKTTADSRGSRTRSRRRPSSPGGRMCCPRRARPRSRPRRACRRGTRAGALRASPRGRCRRSGRARRPARRLRPRPRERRQNMLTGRSGPRPLRPKNTHLEGAATSAARRVSVDGERSARKLEVETRVHDEGVPARSRRASPRRRVAAAPRRGGERIGFLRRFPLGRAVRPAPRGLVLAHEPHGLAQRPEHGQLVLEHAGATLPSRPARPAARAGPDRISASRPRRRRDSSPRDVYVAAAAKSTRADTIS